MSKGTYSSDYDVYLKYPCQLKPPKFYHTQTVGVTTFSPCEYATDNIKTEKYDRMKGLAA